MDRTMIRRSRWTPRPGVVGLLAVLALVAAACTDADLDSGDAARVVSGSGLLVASGGDWVEAGEDDVIAEGARVRTGREEVRLELRAGEAWLAAGSAALVRRDHVELVRGDLLIASGGSLGSSWAGVSVSGPGVYRLTPGFAARLGVYRGDVILERPGERVMVSSLRQADLSVRRLATEGAPLAYRHDDAWDRTLLAPAIAFDAEAARLTRGMDREFGTAPQTADFYRGFAAVDAAAVPVLARTARLVDADRFGPASDALLTLFLAQAAATQSGRGVTAMAERIAALRAAGARWGLVATELDVTAARFLAAVDLSPAGSLTTAREIVAAQPAPGQPAPARRAPTVSIEEQEAPEPAPTSVPNPGPPQAPLAPEPEPPADGGVGLPPGDTGRLVDPTDDMDDEPLPEVLGGALDTAAELINDIIEGVSGALLP
jgi:hypothetical protein